MFKDILKFIFPKKARSHTMEIKVAGVTFKNGRKSRQAILRKIKFKDSPFDKVLNVSFQGYDFEGEQAIGVYVNDEQIGNVPKTLLDEFIKYKDNPYVIQKLDVYGGNDGKNFGCSITITFKISNQ